MTAAPLRRLLVVLVTALGLVAAGAAAPATAATVTRPTLVVVPGNSVVTAEWKKVARATLYELQVSTSKSFTKATTKVVKTSATRKVVTRLKVYKAHYVRVRAVRGVKSGWSSVRKATPTRQSVGAIKVTVTGGGADKIKVSWPRLARGTRIVVMPTYSNDTIEVATKSWKVSVPVTRTSATITIPTKFRKLIGSASGNPVYVRVFFYNATVRNRSNIAYGWATPQKVTGTAADRVSIASYNVASVGATASIAGRTWLDRRAAVVRSIQKASADVVAIQEASTAQVDNPRDRTQQYQDLANRLKGSGYALAVPDVGNASATVSKAEHILYRTANVSVVKAGIASAKQNAATYAPTVKWLDASGRTEGDRRFAWALLRSKASGTYFYVASIHLEYGASANVQATRKAAAAGVRGFLADRARQDGRTTAPIVIAGDWNSDVERYPSGPVTDTVAAGYRSAAASTRVANVRYGTANSSSANDHGFPARPTRYTYVGPRIDHILVRNGEGSVAYANQLVLSGGLFDRAYQGSDHNLQVATLSLVD